MLVLLLLLLFYFLSLGHAIPATADNVLSTCCRHATCCDLQHNQFSWEQREDLPDAACLVAFLKAVAKCLTETRAHSGYGFSPSQQGNWSGEAHKWQKPEVQLFSGLDRKPKKHGLQSPFPSALLPPVRVHALSSQKASKQLPTLRTKHATDLVKDLKFK